MRADIAVMTGKFVATEAWRLAMQRLRRSPLYGWRYAASLPEKIIMAPRDLRPSDPAQALEYYAGSFHFAGETVISQGESPFSAKVPSAEWEEELHRFGWLRHLRAADTQLASANASAHANDWIDLWGQRLEGIAWDPDVTAARIMAWLCHAPLLVRHANHKNYRKLLRSLARQTRYLQYNARYTGDGVPRLNVMTALAYSSLCLDGREKVIRNAARELDRELERQILPDGGHISRSPAALTSLLTNLLPLREVYDRSGQTPAPSLQPAIDKMMGALRFFRHSNGQLAQFNGTGETPVALVKTILNCDGTKGKTQTSAPFCGFERLEAGDTTVIADTGKPILQSASHQAMAGTLSFELCSGSTRFVTNCGVPDIGRKIYLPHARKTAAHSTTIVCDTSSSRFASNHLIRSILPFPLIDPPRSIAVERRQTPGFQHLIASHDGYETPFNLICERELLLSADGRTLNGIERFSPAGDEPLSDVAFTTRFHLPPSVTASLLSSRHSILLAGPDNDAWTFTCVDTAIGLEESIIFSGSGPPRKSTQIVIYGMTGTHAEVRWTFERQKVAKGRTAAEPASASRTTGDLLEPLTNPGDQP